MSSIKSLIAFTAGLVTGAAAVTLVLTDKGDKLVEKAKKCFSSFEDELDEDSEEEQLQVDE